MSMSQLHVVATWSTGYDWMRENKVFTAKRCVTHSCVTLGTFPPLVRLGDVNLQVFTMYNLSQSSRWSSKAPNLIICSPQCLLIHASLLSIATWLVVVEIIALDRFLVNKVKWTQLSVCFPRSISSPRSSFLDNVHSVYINNLSNK